MRIDAEVRLDFKDVLIRPKRSTIKSRKEVSLVRTFVTKHSKQELECIPIFAANMDTTGTFAMAKEFAKHQMLVTIHKHYSTKEWSNFYNDPANDGVIPYVAVSCGTSEHDSNLVKEIMDKCPQLRMICIDVANGYSEHFVAVVQQMRKSYPDKIIIAGNVVTGEMVEELLLSGADVVKVGIGPGSVCTTRKQTGVGYPQLSAVIECADAAHGLGGLIISDGGCTVPGDVAKAFGGGADFVMAGGMFAGHEECSGETIIKENGDKVKQFYGMSSSLAMTLYSGSVANYRSSEGKVVEVKYRGHVGATILDLLGGLRSTCTYVGANALKEVSKRTTFIRVTQQLNNIFGRA